MTYKEALHEAGRAYLAGVIQEARGNIAKAAAISGLHRATLYKLLPKYGIEVQRRAYVKAAPVVRTVRLMGRS